MHRSIGTSAWKIAQAAVRLAAQRATATTKAPSKVRYRVLLGDQVAVKTPQKHIALETWARLADGGEHPVELWRGTDAKVFGERVL